MGAIGLTLGAMVAFTTLPQQIATNSIASSVSWLGVAIITAAQSALAQLVATLGQAWSWYSEFACTRPFLAASLIAGITYGIAEWLSQRLEQQQAGSKQDETGTDVVRIVKIVLVGAVLLAPYATVYYRVHDILVPATTFLAPLWKILIDQTIYSTFYNGGFLAGVSLLNGVRIKDTWQLVKQNHWKCLRTGWQLRTFVHTITYTVIPTSHKLLWVCSVEILWATYLSYVATAARKKHEDMQRTNTSPEVRLA